MKAAYEQNSQPIDLGEDGFQTTRRIGSFLLMDDRNKKFCILSNQGLTGKYANPEIFRFSNLDRYEVVSDPVFLKGQMAELMAEKAGVKVIRKLLIRLYLVNGETRDIIILPSPVKTSGMAYRQACKMYERISHELQNIISMTAEKCNSNSH
ncbi:MAG: hypothetical protein SOW08_04405 [Lachnospiraceae bacterium]|nr:hypothetical protein [Lachnospiraceae bacterium]